MVGSHCALVFSLSRDWNLIGSTLGGMGGSVGQTSVRNPLILYATDRLQSSSDVRANSLSQNCVQPSGSNTNADQFEGGGFLSL